MDVASQLLKSRNAGVLRTGAAALRSAAALFDHVIVPALAAPGSTPARSSWSGPPTGRPPPNWSATPA